MSLASFNMFVGGAAGTNFNGMVMENYGVSRIFYNTSYVIFIVGILAAIFIARFEMRKKQGYYNEVLNERKKTERVNSNE